MKNNRRSMTYEQHMILGEQLSAAECAGDLVAAYRMLRLGTPTDAAIIASLAGHNLIDTRDRFFWKHLQNQIAQACRHSCDGSELRQRKDQAVAHG